MNVFSYCLISLMIGIEVGSDPTSSTIGCGQSSCFLLLSQLGKSVAIDELDQHFSSRQQDASLVDLQTALRVFGIESAPWKLSWNEFRQLRGPLICHVDDPSRGFRHFHVAQWSGDDLLILDSMASHPIRVTPDRQPGYQRVFTGNVLVPNEAIPLKWRMASFTWFIVVPIAAVVCFTLLRRAKSKTAPRPFSEC